MTNTAVRTVGSLPLAYTGIPPIATCHWQWVGNLLANRGWPGYWERLGLSWGFRWTGGPVLFGSARWPAVLAHATGIDVSIQTFSSLQEALAAEATHLAAGTDVIVEVDEFHLPRYAEPKHVVHAVLLVDAGEAEVHFVDSRVSADVVAVDVDHYHRMRSSSCEGRVESFKLYAIGPGPVEDPSAAELFQWVRSDLRTSFRQSTLAVTRYIEFVRCATTHIDVCRAAGERYQAALLFAYLSSERVPGCDVLADRFRSLSDRWYFIHMLSVHERAAEERNVRRRTQLLEQLVAADLEATAAVLND